MKLNLLVSLPECYIVQRHLDSSNPNTNTHKSQAIGPNSSHGILQELNEQTWEMHSLVHLQIGRQKTLKSPGRGSVEMIYTVLYPDHDLCLQEEGWIQMKVKALTCRSKSIINFSTESCVSGLHLLMRSLWRRIYPSPPRPYWRGEHRFHFWVLESSRLESSLVMGRVFRWKWERRRNEMTGPGIRVWMLYLYPKPFFARSSGHF